MRCRLWGMTCWFSFIRLLSAEKKKTKAEAKKEKGKKEREKKRETVSVSLFTHSLTSLFIHFIFFFLYLLFLIFFFRFWFVFLFSQFVRTFVERRKSPESAEVNGTRPCYLQFWFDWSIDLTVSIPHVLLSFV